MNGNRIGVPPMLNADAVAAMVRGAVPDLYRYAARLTGGDRALADDLVQEACLALAREMQATPATELGMGWLIVVLRRRYLDQVRRGRRERLRLERDTALSARDVKEPDWSSIDDAAALRALGTLKPDQRVALVLRYVDDLPVHDVAATLGRSVAATESLLARGRRHMAQQLRGDSDG